jgi:predicted acylesterase/phospholipase RssA
MAEKTLELGICMAGAVSAGAYTAGVMDYLLEALEDWERRRQEEGVPQHRVVIKVIGGASAGGMTGIITAAALNNRIEPVQRLDQDDILKEQPQNKLYHSWVDLTQTDMLQKLLATDDIRPGKVQSLLNSDFIDAVAERAMQVNHAFKIYPKYVDRNLKVFTTLSNTKGFPFFSEFQGNNHENNYHSSYHADYATFKLNSKASDYKKDGWMPLDFFTGYNADIARDAAMATGAFPIGLKPRIIERPLHYVNDMDWNRKLFQNFPLTGPDPYRALIVDGGMINNEPFEKLSSLLPGLHDDENHFKATTLMVDPFPSYLKDFDMETTNFDDMISKTLSAMMGHLRTKPEYTKPTQDPKNKRRFQIAPVRRTYNGKKSGAEAIACGFLGGFGGFIHKEFRIHDYFLGRHNCERFLRHHFTVSKECTNEIFVEGYKELDEANLKKFTSYSGELQIIPIFKPEAPTEEARRRGYMPTFEHNKKWPLRKREEIDAYAGQIGKRMDMVLKNLNAKNPEQTSRKPKKKKKLNLFSRVMIYLAYKLFLKRKAVERVLDTVKEDMEKHKLLR